MEFTRHDGGTLQVVALLERRLVLIPILKDRIVLAEEQRQPSIHHSIDVAHVAAVFEWGPDVLAGAHLEVLTFEDGHPVQGILTNLCRKGVVGVVQRIEAAVQTRLLEDPGPVFGVGGDWHSVNLLFAPWRVTMRTPREERGALIE